MWSWLFGTSSRTQVTARDKAILDLKRQRDKIKQYRKRISAVQARERELAKQCLAEGNRQRALIFLRKEKLQRELLNKTDSQLTTLEDLVVNIEFAQIQRDVVFGLEQGNKVLKEINEEMSIDKLEQIMDDTAEGMAYQEEISNMLSERITASEEADIESELAAMEREESHAIDAKFPKVPQTTPSKNKEHITSHGDSENEHNETYKQAVVV